MGEIRFKLCRNNSKEIMSKEEQKKYIELSIKGDYSAREKLFEHNLRLVFFVIDSYFSASKIDMDDLIQAGGIGLWKAIENYNIEKECEFSTYATNKIWGEIKACSRKQKYLLKVPRTLRTLAKQVVELQEKFPDKELSTKELSSMLNVDEQEIISSINSSKELLFLSNPITTTNDDNQVLEDIIIDTNSSIDETIEQKEVISMIGNIIATLNEREQIVINLLYGFNGSIKTQSEISKILNISQPMVSTINKNALNKIKFQLLNHVDSIDLFQLSERKKYNKNDFIIDDNIDKKILKMKI